MKKGQIEIIGLVIVVILIVIGVLFYVKYGILNKKDKNNINLEVSFVNNLLNSLLNVGICDGKLQMDEAIVSCYNNQNFCDSMTCDGLKNEIEEIINLVGLKKFKNFSLWVENKGRETYFFPGCSSGSNSFTEVVGQNKQVYRVNLQLC